MEWKIPTLVGIDHGFSFPRAYFRRYELPEQDWDHFLKDFQNYWPTNEKGKQVSKIRKGKGRCRYGESDWLRRTDTYAREAKSVFNFVGPGVAHSTHAGIPWLKCIRERLGTSVHFWPFDGEGWEIPPETSAIAEVYPALWKHRFSQGGRTNDEHDAYSVAGWLAHADQNGHLVKFLNPARSIEERDLAKTEGWILGTLTHIY